MSLDLMRLVCDVKYITRGYVVVGYAHVRVRLFRLQMNSGNQFPENGAFGCDGKYYFPEMNFLLTEI